MCSRRSRSMSYGIRWSGCRSSGSFENVSSRAKRRMTEEAMSTEALYQEIILEHNRKPKNFREMENADRRIEGRNPLCGDSLTLWVKMDGDAIADVSFKGQGCAISKASASLMTTAVKGKTRDEADP